MSWVIWLAGALLLVAAGFATAYVPRRRARDLRVRVAWSSARAAIDSATVSRDACLADLPQADELLARAESLAASGGGADAADEAAEVARRADQLWRAAADA